ncbi:MAG: hypothetical protein ACK55Z_00065, partial [bacterium]
ALCRARGHRRGCRGARPRGVPRLRRGRALCTHDSSDFVPRQRSAQKRQCPPALHEAGGIFVHVAHQEHPRRERREQLIERTAIHAGRAGECAVESFDHPHLVPLGLQATDEPRAAIAKSLVIEIDRVLRCQHAAETEGATLLEQCQHRRLRRRIGA